MTLRRILIGSISLPLFAVSGVAQESTNKTEQLKPVVVTGSYIPTAETVGPAPVETITAADIEKTGSQDVLQLLTKLSPNFSGANNFGRQANNFSFTGGQNAGESYVAIRNLPTLVLLDGRRLANSALSAGQAVDLNTIPLAMIERIEVLKDGASSLYGSDAIGGVVNIITKKNWSGAEISGRVGFPTRSSSNDIIERRASVVAGTTTDKTSFLAGGSFYSMDPLLAKDRHVASAGIADLLAMGIEPPGYVSPSYPGRVQDAKATIGGVTHPATSYILAGSPFAVGAPGYNPAFTTPPVDHGTTYGRVEDYLAAHPGVYIPQSTTPEGATLTGLGVGNFPLINTTLLGPYSLQKADRRNGFAEFQHDLFDKKVQLFGSFLFANTLSEAKLAPSPVPSLSISSIAVPANNPYNPFQKDLGLSGSGQPRVRYRFLDNGPRVFDSQSDVYRMVGGLKGELTPDYSYETAYTYNRADQSFLTHGAINGAALNLALQPDLTADPTGKLSKLTDANGNAVPTFNIFALPGTGANDPKTLQQINATLFQTGTSELWTMDGRVNGTPVDLPAGKLAFAVGGEYIDERLSLANDGLLQQGLVPGLNATFPFPGGHRDRGAGFAEVLIPLASPQWNVRGFYAFDIDVSGRIEDINPGGTAAVPKVGIRWQPIDNQFTIRGGYSKGFLAPSIFNLFGPDSVSNPQVSLPGGVGQIQTQTRSNPSLPPSDSSTWTVGAVYSPKQIPHLTVGADYYNIEQTKVPIADPLHIAKSLNALGAASPFAKDFTFSDGTKLTTGAPDQVTVDTFGNLIVVTEGSGGLRTDGFDLSVSYSYPSDSWGQLTVFGNANLTLNYEVQADPTQPFYHYEGQYTASGFGTAQGLIPDYRIVTGLTWQYKGFTYAAIGNYIPGVIDLGNMHPQVGDTTHGNTVSGGAWKVPDYYTIDMQVAYEFGRKGGRKWYDGLRLAMGVNNITDEQPPFIASGLEDNTDKSTYDILGRFVYFEVSKRF